MSWLLDAAEKASRHFEAMPAFTRLFSKSPDAKITDSMVALKNFLWLEHKATNTATKARELCKVRP
jgi:hypothetical protein